MKSMSAKKLEILDVDIDHVDPENACRDDACPIVELHAKHTVYTPRGKPPTKCPLCKATYDKSAAACLTCGWTRALGRPKRPHRRTRE